MPKFIETQLTTPNLICTTENVGKFSGWKKKLKRSTKMSFNPDVETKEILKKAISANRALAELKGASRLLPNQNILINTIALEEARDSSAIENIVTTRDKLFRALATDPRRIDPVTKEVLNYRKALWLGFNAVHKKGFISANIITDIQKELISNNAGIRKLL